MAGPANRKRTIRRVAALVLAAGWVATGCRWQPRDRPLRQELLSAFPSFPAGGARFVDLSFAQAVARDRRPDRARLVQVIARLRRIEKAPGSQPPPWVLHDRGLLALAEGQAGKAEDLFATAAAHGGAADPLLLADLGAFYLARESLLAGAKPADPVRALEACEAALAAQPNLREARYNKALALERLVLTRQAVVAWKRYLELDPNSAWATEARRHLRGMQRVQHEGTSDVDRRRRLLFAAALAAIDAGAGKAATEQLAVLVADRPDIARIYGLEVLLGAWARAEESRQSDVAARTLTVAQRLGAALAARRGDLLLQDSIVAITSAGSRGEAAASELVRGHLLFQQALQLEENESYGMAIPTFTAAAATLRRAGSPFALLAMVHLGVCQFFGTRYQEALTSLAAGRGGDRGRYPAVEGYSLWVSGIVHYVMAELPRALADHLAAHRLFQAQGEVAHAGYLATLVADDLDGLGEREEAWRYRRESFARIDLLSDPRRVYSVLHTAADSSLADWRPAAARSFLSEIIARTRPGAPAGVLAEVLGRRGLIEVKLGHAAAARGDVARAREQLVRIEDPSHRSRVSADLDIVEAEVLGTTEPKHALALLDRAVDFFSRAEYRIDSVQSLRARAATYRALRQPERAAQDLESAITDFERGRLELPSQSLRIAYFEQVQGVLEDMMLLQVDDLGHPLAAFLYAEKARARALLDRLQETGRASRPSPVAADTLRRALPPGVRLVEFAVLADRTLAWVIGDKGSAALVLPLGAGAVSEFAHRFRQEIASDNADSLSGLDLYTGLIAPLRPYLQGATLVVVVPDKDLHLIAFSALRDPVSRRFLLEDFAIAVAPSAAACLASRARTQTAHAGDLTMLLVEGDGFNRRVYTGLAPLQAAQLEPRALRPLYREAAVLAGPLATKERTLAVLNAADVIHITAHTEPDPQQVGATAFILAPDAAGAGTGHDSLLTISDIEASRLPHPQVAVLAACATAAALPSSEGSLSLARSFLAAGVPAVVATLWPIDDREATDLLHSFHRRLARGEAAVNALREAQLERLRQGRARTSQWAAYEVLGGVTGDAALNQGRVLQ